MPKYVLYKAAIEKALDKVGKYYRKMDDKPVYVLALGAFLYFQFALMLLIDLQFFIHTINSNTSRSPGEERKNKNRSVQLEIPMPRIGMTRP